MNRRIFQRLLWAPLFIVSAHASLGTAAPIPEAVYEKLKEDILAKYGSIQPKQWSEKLPGVVTQLDTEKKVIALTLDACGSAGDGYDKKLLDYLIQEQIPATLFINSRWIDKHPQEFHDLTSQPLFEIENHGMAHKPCSVNGRWMYGVEGTEDAGQVVDEIELNALKIQRLTGFKPKFYRSGTATYDEVGVAIANELGYVVAGFSVLGDKGAAYSKEEVKKALLDAPPGSIVILHMNRPEGETAEGVMEVIPLLIERGTRFAKLSEYPLK